MLRRLTMITLGVGMLVLTGTASADCRKKIELTPMVAGDYSGDADSKTAGNRTRLSVDIDVPLALVGQVYSVWSNGMEIGSTTIDLLGHGSVSVENNNLTPLPAGVTTDCTGVITVKDAAGAVVFAGAF